MFNVRFTGHAQTYVHRYDHDFSFPDSDVSVLWCGANVALYFLKSKYFFKFVTIPDLTTVWKYCILYADSIKPR